MKPKDVPVEFVDMAVEVFEDQAHEHCSEGDGCPGNTRPYHEALVREALADLLPEHEKQVREQVAAEIEDHYRDKINDIAVNDAADRALTAIAKDFYLAARIARGEL